MPRLSLFVAGFIACLSLMFMGFRNGPPKGSNAPTIVSFGTGGGQVFYLCCCDTQHCCSDPANCPPPEQLPQMSLTTNLDSAQAANLPDVLTFVMVSGGHEKAGKRSKKSHSEYDVLRFIRKKAEGSYK